MGSGDGGSEGEFESGVGGGRVTLRALSRTFARYLVCFVVFCSRYSER